MRKCLIVLTVIFLVLFVSLAQAATFNKRFKVNLGTNPVVAGERMAWNVNLNSNIDRKINFYTENGYSVVTELCHGQKFKVDIGTPTGEWVAEGGWEDCPPIVWVENLEEVMKTVEHVKLKDTGSGFFVSPGTMSYVDNETGLHLYYMSSGVIGGYEKAYALVALVCEKPRPLLNMSGANSLSDNTFIVTSTDKVEIWYNENYECAFYIFCIDWCDVEICVPFRDMAIIPTMGEILEKKSMTVTYLPPEPKIDLASTLTNTQLPPKSSTYMKLTIRNSGNREASIKDIKLNVNSEFLICKSMKLSPGESTECIFSVLPKQTSTIEATVKYQFTACSERQYKTEKFTAGNIKIISPQCLKDRDCPESYTCCESICYDSGEGMCADVNADGVSEWVSTI